jgi:peptidoglycan/xylan/chitin deacetylase (PgdA/CDA1 family)
MFRRTFLYAAVIVSLLGAVTFPGAAALPATAAPLPRRVATAKISTSIATTTTTGPIALAPVITHVRTTEPVVFLTIDDGAYRDPLQLSLMQENQVRASLFLVNSVVHRYIPFFQTFATAGNPVENHSLSHRDLTKLSYDDQVAEICGEADLQAQQFGVRPTLFRPPYGAYNDDTRRAATACGMRAVVTWVARVEQGRVQYQLASHLRPGDIVLMHFRPEFRADLTAFLAAARVAGLRTELLEDWLVL